jgi:hypothetical protein
VSVELDGVPWKPKMLEEYERRRSGGRPSRGAGAALEEQAAAPSVLLIKGPFTRRDEEHTTSTGWCRALSR